MPTAEAAEAHTRTAPHGPSPMGAPKPACAMLQAHASWAPSSSSSLFSQAWARTSGTHLEHLARGLTFHVALA